MQLTKEAFAEPTYTREFGQGEYAPIEPACLLEGRPIGSGRSAVATLWAEHSDINRGAVTRDGYDAARIEWKDGDDRVGLRDEGSVREFLNRIGEQHLYIDITSMSFQVWAQLVRLRLDSGMPLQVIYTEAERYRFSDAPTEGELFDLSTGFEGIAQLPGLISLEDEDPLLDALVPLLGFEGQRLLRVLTELEYSSDRVYPVVGVPGFRLEFPFYSYLGNQLGLRQNDCWVRARFARSNCPFDAAQEILGICDQLPDGLVKVAPIGTKPHCLAAVLAWRERPEKVQIIYDRPRKKDGSRLGAGRSLVFDVSQYVADRP